MYMYKHLNDSDFRKLLTGIDIYDRYFADYEYTYCYLVNNQEKQFTVRFNKNNFLHLSGVKYAGSASSFYYQLLTRHIKQNDLYYREDGYTKPKLDIIGNLEQLFSGNVRVSERGIFVKFKFDHLIRTNREILAVACQLHRNIFVPVSLLNLRRKRLTVHTYEAIKIKRINLKTKEIEEIIKRS